jgi:hypothetical protein
MNSFPTTLGLPLLLLTLLQPACSSAPAPAAPAEARFLAEREPTKVLGQARAVLAGDEDPGAIQAALHSLELLDPASSPEAPLLALRCCHWLADRHLNPTRLNRARLPEPTNCLPLLKPLRALKGQDQAHGDYLEAMLLGLLLQQADLLETAEYLSRFQTLAQELAVKRPELDQGGPLRLLGVLYLRAPEWPAGPGDLDRALELLTQASRDYPSQPYNHLFLAEALQEDGNRDAAASEVAAAKAAVPARWPQWRQDRFQQDLARLLRTLD